MNKEEEHDKKSFGGFVRDCRVEFGKISWPLRKELVASTKVVAAAIFIVTLFIFVCDKVLFWILQGLFALV